MLQLLEDRIKKHETKMMRPLKKKWHSVQDDGAVRATNPAGELGDRGVRVWSPPPVHLQPAQGCLLGDSHLNRLIYVDNTSLANNCYELGKNGTEGRTSGRTISFG